MLTPSVLPSPNLDPAAAAAWYLQNPLLLAAYAAGITRRAAQVAAGEIVGPALHKLAVDLYCERNRLRLKGPVEPVDQEGERGLLDLLQSRYLAAERKELHRWVLTARPSEYAWLRAPIEAAITTRAEVAALKIAAVARLTNTKIIPASQLAA